MPSCRLSLRSHDLTGDKEEFLAEISQILLPARACEVPLQSRGQKNFPYPRCYVQFLDYLFSFRKRNKREGLSPSGIFTHFVRYLLEGASVLRTYSLFLREKKFIIKFFLQLLILFSLPSH